MIGDVTNPISSERTDQKMPYKIGMVSLGCPKNQVDAEIMLAKLEDAGFLLADDPYEADLVIVNTCGFIEDAKREAIDSILEMAELKKDGTIQALAVTGCLAQRYQQEVLDEIPEIDALIGIGANDDIVKVCEAALEGATEASFPPRENMPLEGRRVLTTPAHWAYLKIADGCSNCCTYCAIPGIRGPFRSREMDSIVKEARELADSGVKELILIAQDTTRYGEDLYGALMLPALLDRLCEIEGIEWLRLLYCYPDRITDELLDTMARQPKVLHYLDIPLQHCDAQILKRMNRTGSRESLTALIQKIRTKIPDIVLRTTVMTGFPGEDEEAFTALAEFVRDIRFDRLGCFAYSQEEGTPAAEFPDQVEDEMKKHRAELILQDQYDIVEANNRARIGKTYRAVVEDYDAYTDSYTGRTWMDAPEIDGTVRFTCGYALEDGDFVDVEIFDVSDYDLIGEVV